MEALVPYALVALLVLVQGGELGLMLAGYYVHLDQAEVLLVLPLIVVCMVVGDVVWYYHGCKLYKVPLLCRAEPWLARIDRHIERHPFLIAFLARLSYGLHYLVVARYRGSAISIKRFLRIMLTTSVVWIAIAGGAVFALAEYLPKTRGVFDNLEYIFTGVFVVFLVFEFFMKTAVKRILSRLEKMAT